MKHIKSTVIIFLLGFIIFWWFSSEKKIKSNNYSPENPTQSDITSKQKPLTVDSDSIEKADKREFIRMANINHKKQVSNSSFYAVFEDYLLARFCDAVLRDLWFGSHQTWFDEISEGFYSLYAEDPLRNQLWVDSAHQCVSLTKKYKSHPSSKTAYFLTSFLLEILLETETSTESEDDLKQTVVLLNEYKKLLEVKEEALFSREISDERLSQIQTNYDSLRLRYEAYEREHGSARAVQEQFELLDEMNAADAYINQISQSRSPEAFQQLLNDLEIKESQLIDRLPNVDAYQFSLITEHALPMKAIHGANSDSKDKGFSNLKLTFFTLSGINDNFYYNLLARPVIDYFSCRKGMDCSQNSILVRSHCFGIENRFKIDQACQNDFYDLYHGGLLSTNQKKDADAFLVNLVKSYE